MRDSESAESSGDALLEQFLDELQQTGDSDTLLRRYCQEYPNMVDEFCIQCFMHEFEAAPAGDEVLRRYSERFPHLATELQEQAAMQQRLDQLAPPEETSPPKQLGDFHLVRLIARGGMGEVYEAIQQPLDRRVVVKIIRRGRQTAEARERFLREQRILARLHQTHIVPVHAAGEEGNLQFLAMAYIEGATLHQLVRSLAAHSSITSDNSTPTLADLAKQAAARQVDEQAEVRTVLQQRPVNYLNEELGPAARAKRPPLSKEYFRSAAEMLIDVALALQHAHDAGVIHRDLKPSNIMVDGAGHCWIIDFGLATLVNDRKETSKSWPDDYASALTTASAVMGTPAYMAPEQFLKKADVCSDVWALGATLYELLTLERPFDGQTSKEVHRQIEHKSPVRPRQIIHTVPADLEAICLKALEKKPANRFRTASDFAEDLGRWLRGEPVMARPVRTLRRVALWSRRNPGWAAAFCVAMLAVIAAASSAFLYQRMRNAAVEAKAKTATVKAAQDAAIRENQRLAILRQIESVVLLPRKPRWFDDARKLSRKASTIRYDDLLKGYATALLAGIDASLDKRFDRGASSLAFDRADKRLLAGGFVDVRGRVDAARLWDRRTGKLQTGARAKEGPVAFRAPNGSPVQFFVENPRTLHLWDLQQQKKIQEFTLPGDIQPARRTGEIRPALAVSQDGAFVAVSAELSPKRNPILLVWDARSGKLVQQFSRHANAIVFASDNSFLVTGHGDGTVIVWSLGAGKQIAELRAEGNEVNCLALHRNPIDGDGILTGWRLASGDDGGDIRIWDLAKKRQVAFCRGSLHAIYALSFSPDGALLASGGRTYVYLWDAASGIKLLRFMPRDGNYISSVAFSQGTNHLAMACTNPFGGNSLEIWKLEFGRGALTLRGLTGQILQLRFSADSKRFAALSQHWRVGIWDLPSGRLRVILDVPKGYFADNAAMAFSPNGQQFAFSTGTEAKLWQLPGKEDARVLGAWPLPPGLQDTLAFPARDKLFLIRYETKNGKLAPFSEVDRRKHPRVIQVRDLLSKRSIDPIVTIRKFNWHVDLIDTGPAGSHIVATGTENRRTKEHRLACFDTASGKELWSRSYPYGGHGFELDCTGKLLSHQGCWTRLPSGKKLKQYKPGVRLGPEGKLLLQFGGPYPYLSVYRPDAVKPIIRYKIDRRRVSFYARFNRDGRYLAWGHTDGAVTVADLEQIQKRVAAFDLGR